MASYSLNQKGSPITILLMGFVTALFFLETLKNFSSTGQFDLAMPPQLLYSIGGINRIGVLMNGEWYRLFCAPMYHANLFHLFSNLIALYLCGRFLEPFVGTGWFLLIFFLSALGGDFLSLIFLSDHSVGIGASGGIMGLLSASYIAALRVQEGSVRKAIQWQMLASIVATLLPLVPHVVSILFAPSPHNDGIDHFAHLGGALTGVIIGAVLIKVWPLFEPVPKHQTMTLSVSYFFCFVVVISLINGLLLAN